jgi:hypothetical protein
MWLGVPFLIIAGMNVCAIIFDFHATACANLAAMF